MPKWLTILVAAAFIPIGASGQSNKTVYQQQYPAQQSRSPFMENHTNDNRLRREIGWTEIRAASSKRDAPLKQPEWWLVIFAGITGGVISWQSWETRKAANVSSKTLMSILRPQLIIRRIGLHRGTSIPTFGVSDADPWTVNFELANIGRGSAHILDYGFAISRLEARAPSTITYLDGNADPKPFSLEPGEERPLSIYIDRELTDILRMIGISGLALGYQNTDHIYFLGNARYADALGIIRNIAVCRRYDNASTRFKAVDNPDREYSD